MILGPRNEWQFYGHFANIFGLGIEYWLKVDSWGSIGSSLEEKITKALDFQIVSSFGWLDDAFLLPFDFEEKS